MELKDRIFQSIEQVSQFISRSQYIEALSLLRKLDSKYSDNFRVKYLKVGALIESGLGLNDVNLVNEGIRIGEKLLGNKDFQKFKAKLFYNIANAYTVLYHKYSKGKEPFQYLINNVYLQKAKQYYRESIKYSKKANKDFIVQIWTNYGNCLDSLGRGLEAIDAYNTALKVKPSFSMALGNKAKALCYFANIAGIYTTPTYIECYQILKNIIEKNDLIKYGGFEARYAFKQRIQFIRERFKNKELLKRKIKHKPYNFNEATIFEKFYLQYCMDKDLFLNLHIHEGNCKAAVCDPVFIRLITPASDNKTFYDLAKHINQIKEDFAVARLLLVQSQFRRNDLNRISRITSFANTLDYCEFNIYVGLLKSAFKQAYNILDKISVFLNRYLKLDIKSKIYFTTIWANSNKDKIMPRQEIIDTKNINLYALFDIFLDFKSGYFSRIQDIRNAAMHERLTVYDSVLTNWDVKEDKYNIGYETLNEQTLTLFHLVKAAIIYLINFINTQENQKVLNSNRPVVPVYVDSKQYL